MIRALWQPRQSNSRSMLSVAMLTIALAACGQEVTQQSQSTRLVNAMRVADSSGLMARTFPGRAQAGREVNRSFRVGGPLITFPADVGDEVKAGDVLARIDPQDYETTLRTLEGQLEREEARARRAEADLRRLQNIYKEDPGATSQAAIDRAQQVFDSAVAGVRSIDASVQNARDQLSYTVLEAPFDGVVVETYVENFETVIPKQPILRLLDPSSIEFLISVPESLIGLAPYVENINVTFDALGDVTVPATVKKIGREATQATRTYPVTLVMDQPEGTEILPGMAGKAQIISQPPQDSGQVGIEVPATAVFTGEDMTRSYVWVIDETNKTLSRREVEVGGLSRFGTRITSGLAPGEWIVTKGVHSVEQGEKVRILEAGEQVASS